ncbi:NLR family CARD domain-containing protein 4 [Hyperolius riggenbachi]|uniref:NLR family CARD domain-containing protein 4 n=1 Tax=Hyperolius riggenbachi TaxID=752182 RepID=UPI0035A39320
MDFIQPNFSRLTQRIHTTISTQIVDDLFTAGIFTLEEMTQVLSNPVAQEVARRLVTAVLYKGEESCRYFLRSLESRDHFLYHDLMGSSVLGGLTDEDLEELESQLKRFYNSQLFQNINPLGEEIDIIFNLETTFSDPILWKKDTLNVRREQLSLEDVLNGLKSPCIIEGEAGKGKSTILKRIAFLWASGKCQALKQYKFVFYITLRSTNEGLYETMCEQLFSVNCNWRKKEFLQKIWKFGPKVLFLFDGYDEFSCESCKEIDDLIKHNYRFGSTVIVTTRTESLKEVRHCASLIVETSDFTIEGSKKLISSVLPEEEARELLLQLDETDFMKNLMKTPLFVVIACALRMGESTFYMNTQTNLFCTLYDLMIERSQHKIRDVKLKMVKQNIDYCGDLALDGLFNHKYDFRREHLGDIEEDILLKIGLLNKYGAQKPIPIYRFFHTSFQEYTAGRRLSQLLSSEDTSVVEKGECYLNRMLTANDITSRFKNLLFYTCGSSKIATQKVIHHIKNVCKDDISDQSNDFVEFGINLFFESATESELNDEFQPLFSGRTLHIDTYNIASHHIDFFKYLPSCLSVLDLVKLDLLGPEDNTSNEDGEQPSNKPKTFISEKVVQLFFVWTQALQTMEVSLKNFSQLNKYDIKYLGKICCCAERLRLNINCCAGLSGNLEKIVEHCKRMQDLIIDSTPLSPDDERRIVEMTSMKSLSISNMNIEHQEGNLLHGLGKLVEVEKLVLNNIQLNETDAEVLANDIKCLGELRQLQLSALPDIGHGVEHIIEAISCNCYKIKELHLNNCCLTSQALKYFTQHLKNLRNLEVLDFTDNFLEEDGKHSVEELGKAVTELPSLTSLMLPGGTDLRCCLDGLVGHLKTIPILSQLTLKRWKMTDDDMKKLASHFIDDFRNLSSLDLSYNNVGSDGWISLIEALQNLKNLKHVDLSTEDVFVPIGLVVRTLCSVVRMLPQLCSLELNNWELDAPDLLKMKNAKLIYTKGAGEYQHIFQIDNTVN